MKENKQGEVKKGLESVLKAYYERYVTYKKAYESKADVRKSMEQELKETLEDPEGSAGTRFKNAVREYVTQNSLHSMEVSNAASRFFITASVYQIATGEELSQEMATEYMHLEAQEFKSRFSIKDGNFVKNSNEELPEMPQEEYDFYFGYFSEMLDKE